MESYFIIIRPFFLLILKFMDNMIKSLGLIVIKPPIQVAIILVVMVTTLEELKVLILRMGSNRLNYYHQYFILFIISLLRLLSFSLVLFS